MQPVKEPPFDYLTGDLHPDPEKPDLIFIHGAAMNARFWEPQVTGLSHAANCFALNLPGRESSSHPACTSVGEQAAHVLAFADQKKLRSPVVCGLSMGGGIVLSLLADHPSRFSRGVVINSGARLRVTPALFETIQNDFKSLRSIQAQFGLSPHTPTESLQPLLDASAIDNADTAMKDFTACDAFDIMERLQRIHVPVLVLTASEDILCPVKYGQYLMDHLARATFRCVERAGHLSPVEQPETVNRAILEFLSAPL